LQLFDFCLAPDTVGDGTGCDNMTAVIVRFKRDGGKVNGDKTTLAVDAVQKESPQSAKRKESNEGAADHPSKKAKLEEKKEEKKPEPSSAS
jgi:protein phosphatase 1G